MDLTSGLAYALQLVLVLVLSVVNTIAQDIDLDGSFTVEYRGFYKRENSLAKPYQSKGCINIDNFLSSKVLKAKKPLLRWNEVVVRLLCGEAHCGRNKECTVLFYDLSLQKLARSRNSTGALPRSRSIIIELY